MRNATFCDILHEKKTKSRKQTLESAQYRLEISFKSLAENMWIQQKIITKVYDDLFFK